MLQRRARFLLFSLCFFFFLFLCLCFSLFFSYFLLLFLSLILLSIFFFLFFPSLFSCFLSPFFMFVSSFSFILSSLFFSCFFAPSSFMFFFSFSSSIFLFSPVFLSLYASCLLVVLSSPSSSLPLVFPPSGIYKGGKGREPPYPIQSCQMGRVVGQLPAGLVPFVFSSGGRLWVWIVSGFSVFKRERERGIAGEQSSSAYSMFRGRRRCTMLFKITSS